MTSHRAFARTLEHLLGPYEAVRVTVDRRIPLWVARFRTSCGRHTRIALSKRRLVRGRRRRDPEILLELHEATRSHGPIALPISFRSDITRRVARVYLRDRDGNRVVRRVLQRDITEFSVAWFGDLQDQGFLDRHAMREVLR